ncbi:MAG TPA: hypothetical protein VMI52_05705 [Acetobacteraceae bacterium]|nr:hypothetical protein [Acetobacteraceae bacterium]
MSEPRIRVTVSETTHTAQIELLPASGLAGTLDFSLEQLTTLINTLGQARAALVAKTPVPPIEGAPVNPVYTTRWAVQPEALTEGSVIAFQHPAYGPVGFVLPPADAEKVVRALTMHLGMVHSQEADKIRPS